MDDRPRMAMDMLIRGNRMYIDSSRNPADISQDRRSETSEKGQKPYAAIITCADSRVSPEHVFSAGIGELFVVRTAGNVVGVFEVGSIEFAAQQFSVPLVVVMGHTSCGAVKAAFGGQANGYVDEVVKEVKLGLNGASSEGEAIRNNVLHSERRLMQSSIISGLVSSGQLKVACAVYDISTGRVNFL